MKVMFTKNKPIKIWANIVEEGAIEQAVNLANMPYTYKHVALMPDTHQGFGMPIGAVLATEKVIVPNAVGVDINCGMVAVKTSIPNEEMNYNIVEDIMKRVERDIPVGFGKHKESHKEYIEDLLKEDWDTLPVDGIVLKEFDYAGYQVGTLGGGNHFIEMDKGSDGKVWLMLHSGSRGIGNKVGTHYNKLAIQDNKEHYIQNTVDADLAFLPPNSYMETCYIAEMNFCMDYADISRKLMMDRFIADVREVIPTMTVLDKVAIQHNFVDLEHHFGKNIWVHRKGAVPASKGEMGIIAGSQGTASYIVVGLGNHQSFMTCSHGAGRVLGRKEAVKTLSLQEEQAKMSGIYNNMNSVSALDEAPSCYKDIAEVMKQQEDLAKPIVELKPLGVVKG